MPVPVSMASLTTSPATNSPAASESTTTNDDYLRTHASFLAQLYQGTGFAGTLSPATALRVGGATQGQVGTRAGGGTGVTANGSYDDIVIDNNSGNCGISILSGAAATGGIAFGATGNSAIARLTVDHATDEMSVTVNNSEAMRFFSNQNVSIGRNADGGVQLLVDRLGSGTLPAPTAGTVATFAGCSSSGSSALISIVSGDAAKSAVNFSSTAAEALGRFEYDHVTNRLSLWAGGVMLAEFRSSDADFNVLTAFNEDTFFGKRAVVNTQVGEIGYFGGSGGTVTQPVSKAQTVTLDKPTGVVTTHNASLAAGAVVTFAVNNGYSTSLRQPVVALRSGAAAPGSYLVTVESFSGSGFVIGIRNMTGGALAEALQISFYLASIATS